MTLQEICEAVKNNSITFDTKGHAISKYFKEHFIERYESTLKGANGDLNGSWSKRENQTTEQVDASMRDFYQRILSYHDYQNEEPILSLNQMLNAISAKK